MRIERIVSRVHTLGPGSRLCIWTNGCNKHCKGCVSKRLQKIDSSTEIDIISTLKEFDLEKVDGITISGGEPFIQASELKNTIEYLNKIGIKDILLYTGYTIDELIAMHNSDIDYILENIGVLIDGEYIDELNDDTIPLRGSSNQRIIFINSMLEPLYRNYLSKDRDMETYYISSLKLGVGIPTRDYIKKF